MSKQDGYSPVHDRLTPQESARQVAQFKTMFGGPYLLAAFAACGKVQPLIEAQASNDLLAALKSPPEFFRVVSYETLSALLKDWRRFEPEGEWLLVIKGQDIRPIPLTERAKSPLGFIDTPVLEKAIKWHNEQGHPGNI